MHNSFLNQGEKTWLHQLLRVKTIKNNNSSSSKYVIISFTSSGNFIQFICNAAVMSCFTCFDIDGLVQERRNSIANALELHLSCTNPWIWSLLFLHNSSSKMHAITHCWIIYPKGSNQIFQQQNVKVFLIRAHFLYPHTTISLWFHKPFVNQYKNIRYRNGKKLLFESMTPV